MISRIRPSTARATPQKGNTTTKKIDCGRGGLKIRGSVKAGGLSSVNHSRGGLKVRGAVKAGGLLGVNHNRRALIVSAAS